MPREGSGVWGGGVAVVIAVVVIGGQNGTVLRRMVVAFAPFVGSSVRGDARSANILAFCPRGRFPAEQCRELRIAARPASGALLAQLPVPARRPADSGNVFGCGTVSFGTFADPAAELGFGTC